MTQVAKLEALSGGANGPLSGPALLDALVPVRTTWTGRPAHPERPLITRPDEVPPMPTVDGELVAALCAEIELLKRELRRAGLRQEGAIP